MEQPPRQPADGGVPGQGAAGHPIDLLMRTALESIKSMVDVNTILGVPVEAPDGTVIIPVSRVSFGFVAGGSEFETQQRPDQGFPFGGGSGAGVSLSPVAFLVVGKQQVRLLPVSERALYDRLLDLAPRLVEQWQRLGGAERRPQDEAAGAAGDQAGQGGAARQPEGGSAQRVSGDGAGGERRRGLSLRLE